MNATPKIRVLIVDDSFFMRKLLKEMLTSDERIEVVGTAKDGVEAVGQAARLQPEVITMDFRMPRLNGAEAAQEILRNTKESLPAIIMLSAYTKEGAQETLECLRAGAVDFLAKPSGELSVDIDKIENELVRKIYVAAQAVVQRKASLPHWKKKKENKISGLATRMVVIGSSTGGPPVVEDILTNLPEDFSASILIVQHMPEYFISKFADRLNKLTPFYVEEAVDGQPLWNGQVLIAPNDHYIGIKRDGKNKMIVLKAKDRDEKGLSTIDKAMLSAAHAFPGKVTGVLLTGMGEDGRVGMQEIKKQGGCTIVQSLDTAVVDSMPEAVIKDKIADEILGPSEIAKFISKQCNV